MAFERTSWRVKPDLPDAPDGFPFAVVDRKGAGVCWVKNKADAQFIAKAGQKLSSVESRASRYQMLYAGSMIRRK